MSRDGNSKRPGFVERTIGKVRDAGASALRNLADRVEGPVESFEVANLQIPFQVDAARGTIWATQQQFADLYGRDKATIREHLKNLYEADELDKDSVEGKFPATGPDGKTYQVTHYRLAAILKVGFRVHSPRAAEFREWAAQKLERYVVDGFVLNEERLRNDPAAVQSLAEKVREIRFDEKNLYARVRDCVAAVASDYDGSSDEIRRFFAKMQDKFHYAACEKTAQQLLLARADGTKERMGMTTQINARSTLADAKIAKNYLSPEELKLQMLAGEAFFVYVENMLARGRQMTTGQLLAKIDEAFKFNEIPQFPGYVGPYIKPVVDAHVKAQYDLFKTRSARERYDEARRLPPA